MARFDLFSNVSDVMQWGAEIREPWQGCAREGEVICCLSLF